MDTTTVLSIIEMIDVRIKAKTDKMAAKGFEKPFIFAHELIELRDHLQGLIEAELSAVENQTEQ